MKLSEAKFKRRFSVNYYRDLKLPMGEMSFYKDWVNAGKRGDPYPIIAKKGELSETVKDGKHKTSFTGEGGIRRLAGAYFPWATYDVSFEGLCGSVGLSIMGGLGAVEISLSESGELTLFLNGEKKSFAAPAVKAGTLSVSFRGIGVSVYVISSGEETLVCDMAHPIFMKYCHQSALADAKILLCLSGCDGETVINSVSWHLSAGISQADIRPIKYEDGTPIIEGGRVFLTASARSVEHTYQVVLSWCPTACDFRLEGGLFFDCGDGYLCGDVASSVIFDRKSGEWKIYMCAFSHGHIIGSGTSLSDPRFGINVIDIETMPAADEGTDKRMLLGFSNDEDPDVINYNGKWYMAVCRSENDGYHYYHFVSDNGTSDFKFLARTEGCEKTGGSYVRAEDGLYFVCGSDFKARAVYDVYTIDDLTTPISHLSADFDDGGFRGWGSIMMLPIGSKMRYTWITFDRHLGSAFNWSYGNIYVLDSESFKPSKGN